MKGLNPMLQTLVDALVSTFVYTCTYMYIVLHTLVVQCCLGNAGCDHRWTPACLLSPPPQLLVGIQNESPYVRDMAVLCLGLACLLDVSVARKHLLLFIQV